MPASVQAAMSSGAVSAVTAMIGTPALGPPPARIRRVASRPSISGIRTSMKIRSKAVCSQILTAVRPSAAVAISQPSGCRINWRARRLMSWSSTTSTRIGRPSSASLSSVTGWGSWCATGSTRAGDEVVSIAGEWSDGFRTVGLGIWPGRARATASRLSRSSVAGAASALWACSRNSDRVKLVPVPGLLRTVNRPPISSASWRLMARPSPVPP